VTYLRDPAIDITQRITPFISPSGIAITQAEVPTRLDRLRPMPTIAISYRRSDSSAIAGRIFDRLAAHFGDDSVFMDVDNIPVGVDFRSHIDETLHRTDILLAVIGVNWLGHAAAGSSRLQEKADPVRVEIETAVARKIRIIPVLVDGAKMPDATELPAEFGNFAYLNAAEVATGRDFRAHMERLIDAINRTMAAPTGTSLRQAHTIRRLRNIPGGSTLQSIS
jgi:hypothetical protein